MKFKNILLISFTFLGCGLLYACNEETSSSSKEKIATEVAETSAVQKASYSEKPEITHHRITSNVPGL